MLVSVPQGGGQGNGLSFSPSGSDDGSQVAFELQATNMVAGDSNNTDDVFVRDLKAGKTERVSVAGNGAQADQGGVWPSMSGDGSRIAFTSEATNLVPGDTNGRFTSSSATVRPGRRPVRAFAAAASRAAATAAPTRRIDRDVGQRAGGRLQSDSALVPDDKGRSVGVFVHTLPATP